MHKLKDWECNSWISQLIHHETRILNVEKVNEMRIRNEKNEILLTIFIKTKFTVCLQHAQVSNHTSHK